MPSTPSASTIRTIVVPTWHSSIRSVQRADMPEGTTVTSRRVI
jgi:hypothetical protein